jgi:hypothetical protein
MENKCSSGANILSNMLAITDSFSVIASEKIVDKEYFSVYLVTTLLLNNEVAF